MSIEYGCIVPKCVCRFCTEPIFFRKLSHCVIMILKTHGTDYELSCERIMQTKCGWSNSDKTSEYQCYATYCSR